MCEKNFEGRVMSPSSTSEDDINDETIIDNEVNDDVTSEIVKKTKKKKRSKSKVCLTCGQNISKNKKRDALSYKNTYHQLRTKEYCDVHEAAYSHHKCKPNWCGDCGYFMNYQIEVQTRK